MQDPRDRAALGLIEAYLPRTLIERLARTRGYEPTWHERLTGTLMHCDMSGFTAMSERLAGRGKEGAELMVGVLIRFFSRMLGVADGWGGVQMKFGGDAMLLYFGGEAHAARAAACALEMQRAMREFRTVTVAGEEFALRMRAGFHSGAFLSASAGDTDAALHYLLIGRDVTMAAATEALAPLGGVVASAESAAQLPLTSKVVRHGDVTRVTAIDEPARPSPSVPVHVQEEIARRYLLPPFAEEFARGRVPHVVAEHRRVTAVFINLTGLAELETSRGDDEVARQAGAYVRMALLALQRHGGFLVGSDAGDHGDKLIAMFGAPVGTEQDEANAMRFAIELDRRLRDAGLDIRHQIGVSTGGVFAGEVGSADRREYTIIGDSVNLAARLMAAAPAGQTYVAAATAERAGADGFALRRLRPLRVKGKSEPVRAFALEGERARSSSRRADQQFELVGREAELRSLLDAAEAVARAGAPGWMNVSGEAGIGKSALTDVMARRLDAHGWRQLSSFSQMHLSRDVFAAWREPLSDLFGVTPEAADGPLRLREEVARLAPGLAEFAALVAPLVGLPDEDEASLRYLDARARRQRISDVIVASLQSAARERPLLLLFEDMNLADEPSLELLAEVLTRVDAPIVLCTTTRPAAVPDALASHTAAPSIELRELPADDARRVAVTAGASERDADAVVARAQGNPLFLQELALAADAAGMPENINDVILARIDRLRGDEKALLRAAAIEGVTFRRSHLGPLLGGRVRAADVGEGLRSLTDAGFTRRLIEPQDAYTFRHALTQEVLYDTLPFADRRVMHGTLAREIERESGDTPARTAAVLLYHFERAEDWPKGVVYAAMAGDRAAQVYAGSEAISYYARGVSAVQRVPLMSASDLSLLTQRIGETMEMQGRHGAAAEALRDALTMWRWRGTKRARRLLKPDIADSARESALARSLAAAYERSHAGYDEALQALDEAIAALPHRSGAVGAQVFATKSVTHYRRGEYRLAVDWGKRALAAAKRTGDVRAIAYAHNMLANPLSAEGHVRLAVRHLRESVRLYEEAEDIPGFAAASNNLGAELHQMGELVDALANYRVALAAHERTGDTVDMAIVHNNIGEILLIQGKLDEAEYNLNSVLQTHGEEGELAALAGLANVNLCRLAMARGELHTAGERLREGVRLLRGAGARGLLTEARLQRAELLLARGDDVAAALREAERGYNEARESGELRFEARGERIIGAALAAQGKHAAAIARLNAGASLSRKIGEGYEEALSLLALADAQEALGRRGSAASQRRASEILKRMGAVVEKGEVVSRPGVEPRTG